MNGVAKRFVELLLYNLKSAKRFPNGYKFTLPYNVMTLLDPRFATRTFKFMIHISSSTLTRYSDLYFNADEYKQAVSSLCASSIYDGVVMNRDRDRDTVEAGGSGEGPTVSGVQAGDGGRGTVESEPGGAFQSLARPDDNSFTRRRYVYCMRG